MKRIPWAILSLFFGIIQLLCVFTAISPDVWAEDETINLDLPSGWSIFSKLSDNR